MCVRNLWHLEKVVNFSAIYSLSYIILLIGLKYFILFLNRWLLEHTLWILICYRFGFWFGESTAHNTRQQDFGTWNVNCFCNVTFHTGFKYAITIFPSPTVFVQWHFLLLIFQNFRYFLQWFFYTWTNILNGFEQRVVTNNLLLPNH